MGGCFGGPMKKLLNSFVLIIMMLNLVIPISFAQERTAVVYYNEACSMCSMYIMEELALTLKEAGIQNIVKKDYVNEKQNRAELTALNKKHNIPPNLQGHFVVFIDDNIILGGHVPKQVVVDLLTQDLEFDKILVLQDEMDEAESYFVWGFKGDAKEYSIDTSIHSYIDWFNENKESLTDPESTYEESWGFSKMIPLIMVSGFLDGINPCAFGVLLFFIAFLFTIKKTKAKIFKMGVVYIIAIYLAYLLIGLGLMQALLLTGEMHLMAKISAWLIIFLGIINLTNYFFPKFPIKLRIPTFTKASLQKWMHKSTLPAAFILGFLVGLCTFPCSGGVYVAVITLLATKTTYAKGLVYLLIYNLVFVAPLIIILLGASNKLIVDKMSNWERSKSKGMRLLSGLLMVSLGIIILIWFV